MLWSDFPSNINLTLWWNESLQSKGLLSRSLLVKIEVYCPWKRCVLVLSSSFLSPVMRPCPQSNAVIRCAWTCLYQPHGWQKRASKANRLPENTTVEFSHFDGVHYAWKICLLPASPWQTWVTLCDPVSSKSGTGTQTEWADLALSATSTAAS